LESEYIRNRPVHPSGDEEKSFPHLMPFFDGTCTMEDVDYSVPRVKTARPADEKLEFVSLPSRQGEGVISSTPPRPAVHPRGGWEGLGYATEEVLESPPPVRRHNPGSGQITTMSIDGHSISVNETELGKNGQSRQIRCSEFETPGTIVPHFGGKLVTPEGKSSSEATQEFYLEESVSQDEYPEEESDGVDVSEEDPENTPDIPRKRKSSFQDDSEGPGSGKSGKSENPQPKKRQRTSPEQLEILERVYTQERLPGLDLRKELAQKLKMTPRRVQVWFQNKRAKEKRMVTANTEFSEYARSISQKST